MTFPKLLFITTLNYSDSSSFAQWDMILRGKQRVHFRKWK